jgi:hypothetical protein
MSQCNSLYSYLKQTKIPFFKNRGREGKTSAAWELVSVSGEDIRKGYSRVSLVELYVLMYENGKMRPVETVPGIGRESIKENGRRGEFNYDTL